MDPLGTGATRGRCAALGGRGREVLDSARGLLIMRTREPRHEPPSCATAAAAYRHRLPAAVPGLCPYGRCDQRATALDRMSCGSVGAGQDGIMKTTPALLVGM